MEIRFRLKKVHIIELKDKNSFVFDTFIDGVPYRGLDGFLDNEDCNHLCSIFEKINSTTIQLPYKIEKGMVVDLKNFNQFKFTEDELMFINRLQQTFNRVHADKRQKYVTTHFRVEEIEACNGYVQVWLSNSDTFFEQTWKEKRY